MENMNKILSFILGLVVIIVITIMMNGKFKLFPTSSSSRVVSVMPYTPTPQVTRAPSLQARNVKSIPNTGVPIILFPLLGSSLISGLLLKNKGK